MIKAFTTFSGYGMSKFQQVSYADLPRTRLNVCYSKPFEESSPFYLETFSKGVNDILFSDFSKRLSEPWGIRYLVTSDTYNAPMYNDMKSAYLTKDRLHFEIAHCNSRLLEFKTGKNLWSDRTLLYDALFLELSKYCLGFKKWDRGARSIVLEINSLWANENYKKLLEIIVEDFTLYSKYILALQLPNTIDKNKANSWYINSCYSYFKYV